LQPLRLHVEDVIPAQDVIRGLAASVEMAGSVCGVALEVVDQETLAQIPPALPTWRDSAVTVADSLLLL
jgi:hypothetical protein